jgi:hypothetical protein
LRASWQACQTYLADDPDRTENERHIHPKHDLDESLHEGHHAFRVRVLLHRLEDEVKVQRLLGRSRQTRIEEGGVERAVEPIGDSLGPNENESRFANRRVGKRTRFAAETW